MSEGKRDGIINLSPSHPCPLQLCSLLREREVPKEEPVAGVGQADRVASSGFGWGLGLERRWRWLGGLRLFCGAWLQVGC